MKLLHALHLGAVQASFVALEEILLKYKTYKTIPKTNIKVTNIKDCRKTENYQLGIRK